MSKQGGFTTTTPRSVLTEASEVYFNVQPPIQEETQEYFRMGEGAKGSKFFEEQTEELQTSHINPSPTQDTLDLAPSVSGSPGHRIPKRPISGNHYVPGSDDDDEESISSSTAVLPISSSRAFCPSVVVGLFSPTVIVRLFCPTVVVGLFCPIAVTEVI